MNSTSQTSSLLAQWSQAVGERLLAGDQQGFEAAFRQARNTGTFHLEARVLRGEEEIRWVVAEGRLYRDEQGRPVRLTGTSGM